MSSESIGTSIHFRPLHTFGWFAEQGLSSGPGGTPNADRVAGRALSLPFHTRLTDQDIERVCSTLHDALGV
jgi:dTDP-4-amino-4,6-dideoxygalactose transaminase